MEINPDTMLMARINKKANSRGITPYNNYLQRSNINALCLELHNPNLKELLNGMKDLGFKGAITVAFEYDQEIFDLIDEVDPIAKRIGLVGFVTLRDGKYTGYAQGGWGLVKALTEKTDLAGKKIVLFGAGHMARGLLAQLEAQDIKPKEIEIYNRTTQHAESVADEYKNVTKVGTLKDFERSSGDILVNVSETGAPWRKGGEYVFSEDVVKNFDIVADVNFVPLETQLIQVAKAHDKTVIPGWVTFQYGTLRCLEMILDIQVDTKILGEELVSDFTHNWS